MGIDCKSILIVSYYAYPSAAVGAKRVSELAKALDECGHETVTLSAKGPDLLDDAELLGAAAKAKTIRVGSPQKLYPTIKNLLGRRLRKAAIAQPIAQAEVSIPENRRDGPIRTIKRWLLSLEAIGNSRKLWCVKVIVRLVLMRFSTRFDLVLASGPPQVAYYCGAIASKLHRAPLVLDFRDPWPSSLEHPPSTSSKFSRWVSDWIMKRALSRTSASVFTAHGAMQVMTGEHSELAPAARVIYNGFDGTIEKSTSQLGQGSLTLMFAGTLYINRDPFPFFSAIKSLSESLAIDRNFFRFKLLGQCERAMGIDVQPWLELNGLDDIIQLIPPVSPAEAKMRLHTADVLINFAQGQPNQIPAKLFEYIASGKFVLQISEHASDSAKVLIESGVGQVVEPENQKLMCDTLKELYEHYVSGVHSHLINPSPNIARYSRTLQNTKYVNLLNSVT